MDEKSRRGWEGMKVRVSALNHMYNGITYSQCTFIYTNLCFFEFSRAYGNCRAQFKIWVTPNLYNKSPFCESSLPPSRMWLLTRVGPGPGPIPNPTNLSLVVLASLISLIVLPVVDVSWW